LQDKAAIRAMLKFYKAGILQQAQIYAHNIKFKCNNRRINLSSLIKENSVLGVLVLKS
jgi:hypothetical protein